MSADRRQFTGDNVEILLIQCTTHLGVHVIGTLQPPPANRVQASTARMFDDSDVIYFEDFEVGQTRRFGNYEVTEGEIIAFASKFDPQPFHLERDAARKSVFGDLCASGWHTCAMTMRMMVDHMTQNRAAAMGSPGVDEIRWLKPVLVGDVLSVESEVVDTRASNSRPGLGFVKVRYKVSNQRGEAVMTMVGNGMFACRPPAA